MGSAGDGMPHSWASEPIAIIGMSSKFAEDATDNEGFWNMLTNKRSGWTPFPHSRFRLEGVYHPNNERLNSTHVKGAHFLKEDVGLFDAAFFGYSSETASSLDPQYRLQLESVYEALESAGLPIAQVAGSNTSVFTGVFVHDYRDSLLRDADNLPRLMATGTGVPMMSNRISHFFDLHGASMTIETACSSGMVALHQAIQSLRTYEADLSIVGGANLTLNPDMFKALGSSGFLSGDGRCYAFDSRASGYGRGEGVATLLVKRLKDALADGDPIRAVIRESILNQDGKTETITTPSPEAQEALIRECYRRAGLRPEDTQYFEAHGTGTQAGDTIEARAIATVFGDADGRRGNPLLIGSVKTNIGHTEAASGLASIIKTTLAMERGVIPPSINFEKPNPKIPLEHWNLKLVRDLTSWPPASSRRASINNFGYGGTNAHIIMESSHSWIRDSADDNGHGNGRPNGRLSGASMNGNANHTNEETKQVLVISAKDQTACQRMVSNLKDFLVTQKESIKPADSQQFLKRLVYTLGQHRSRFPWVAAYPIPVNKGIDAAIKVLDSPAFKPNRSSRQPRIGMAFTGQGAQWHAMGRELVNAYPTYKASLETAEAYLKELGASWSLLEELSRDADASRINEVELSTPICVAVQISLVRLLRSWGIMPVAVTSHSSGEIAAAYAADALSYREAMTISYYRAVLAAEKSLGRAHDQEEGAMIAVGLSVTETESYLRRLTQTSGKAVVACINSPSSTTVSGDVSAVKELEQLANMDGVFARRLRVNTAWHSHHMFTVAEAYVEAIDRTKTPAEGKKHGSGNATASNDDDHLVAFSSPVTGGRVSHLETLARSRHWVDSLVRPVRFVEAYTDMVLGKGGSNTLSSSSSIPLSNVDVIIEVGPHTALGGPIKEIHALPDFQGLEVPYYGSLVRNTDAQDSMQALAASLLRGGYPVDMDAVNFANGRSHDVKVLTTLPLYPWNHQTRHWVEPRLNRSLRTRSEPPHDLLGFLVEGSNPAAPSWRHTLRISDVPWTRDHVIQSTIVFPAAGYVCLAIEAIRQLSTVENGGGDRSISGYRLRDVDFMQALLVPTTSDGIEIQTLLRNASNKDLGSQGWKHFEVWTVTADNRWTQHAKGLVSVEFDKALTPEAVEPALKGRVRRILPTDLFANLRALGIAHGPMFQNMEGIIQSGSGSGSSRSVVTMAISDTSVPTDLRRDPVVHPVTLDSIITAPYSTLPAAAARQAAAKVPRAVQDIWVSGAISNHPGHLLRAHSYLVRDDSQDMEVDVSVFDHDSGSLVLEMRGFSYQSLGRNIASLRQAAKPWENELHSVLKWSPDISMGSPATFASIRKKLSSENTDNAPDDIGSDATRELWRICVTFMQQALDSLNQHHVDRMEPHHTKYYSWMVGIVQQAASGRLCIGSAEWLYDKEPKGPRQNINQVGGRAADIETEVICRLGIQLADILRGEMSLLPLMTQDGLLARFYDNMPTTKRTGSQLSRLLAHLIHKSPRARILEIGAGTGAMTRHALSALGTAHSGGPAADLYHYTDVSAALFDSARENLAPWSDLLAFEVLDPGRAPAAQGFVDSSYDVVIASDVESASTDSVSRTLNTARSLLKPGGTLLLTEAVKDKVVIPFVQGLLLPEKKVDTVLAADVWDKHLSETGFSGVSLELRNCDDSSQVCTSVAIMSTVPPIVLPEPYVEPENVLIVTSKRVGPPPSPWLNGLRAMVGEYIPGGGDLPVAVQDLESAAASSYANKFCVFVGEVNEPILYDLNPISMEGIRAMCTNCKGLLWLTRGGAVDCERPEFSLAHGFMRTLGTEHVGRRLITLDLDPASAPWADSSASAIAQVLRVALFDKADAGSMMEPEYAERDGVILIPRFYHDAERDRVLASRDSLVSGTTLEASRTSMEPFHQKDRPLCMKPDTFVFVDDEYGDAYRDSPLPPELLEVEPRAYGVSSGPANKAQISSLECAGIVTRVGSGAAAKGYEVGDAVVCVLHQKNQLNFPSIVTVEWSSTVHKPPELSFHEAASLPLVFLTAYFSLVEVARLRRAQWVLIHAAAEPVGQAAIMIAQSLEAKVLATVDSTEKQDTITEKYGIPAECIFDTSDQSSFSAAILTATQGHGVDVVLNSLDGPLLQQSFNLVAPFGHFLEIGKHDTMAKSNLEMRPFARSVSLTSVDIDLIMESRYKAADVHRCLKEIMRLVETRAVAPVHPIIPYALGDVPEASRLVQQSGQKLIGKIVFSASQNETVPVLQVPRPAKLAGGASYLIVGGNGGLGQSVAHWMVSRGARNLILVSRNAAGSGKTAVLARELQEAGCHRVLPVSCDVADEDDLARAIQDSAAEGLPPIRGVVHAAFALHDSFVEKMTFEDWKNTTQSKIAGAWNLHSHFNLPGDLDFFILFSSINGLLGYASQAAYSAAGAYEDALAHWRVKQCDLPAVSIDLPVIDAVGYVAEAASSEKLRRSLIKAGHRPIDPDVVLASLESAIQAPYDPQFAVGINSGPGPHWEADGSLGRDPRALPLKYRPPPQAAAQQQQPDQPQEEGDDSLAAKMAACTSRDEAVGVVGEAMAEVLAEMFLVPVEDIDMSESPSHQGIDSLMAVELRNMLFSQAGAEISIFNIMQADKMVTLAASVVDCSSYVKFPAELQ